MGKGLIRLWSGTAVKPQQVQSTCSPGLPGDAGAAASGASGWCSFVASGLFRARGAQTALQATPGAVR